MNQWHTCQPSRGGVTPGPWERKCVYITGSWCYFSALLRAVFGPRRGEREGQKDIQAKRWFGFEVCQDPAELADLCSASGWEKNCADVTHPAKRCHCASATQCWASQGWTCFAKVRCYLSCRVPLFEQDLNIDDAFSYTERTEYWETKTH